MVSSDSFGEVFYLAEVEQVIDSSIKVRSVDNPGRVEVLLNNDERIWRGTIESSSWTKHGMDYRPNSRAFEIDYESLAKEVVSVPEEEEEEISPWLSHQHDANSEKHFLEIVERFWKLKFEVECIPWPPFGYIVPLMELWNHVHHFGGYDVVCENDLWNSIGEKLTPNRSVSQFPFMLKHTYRLVLLEVERAGGVESVEAFIQLTQAGSKPETLGSPPSEAGGSRKRVRRGVLHSADVLLSSPESQLGEEEEEEEEILTAERALSRRRTSSRLSASRAVQEYRASIGLVALTTKAKGLRKGDKVDVRLYKNSSLGPWRLAEILTVATASAFEGYRRFHVQWISQKEDAVTTKEWVPILARPSAWGTTLSKPSVLIRPATEPNFPPVKNDAGNLQRTVGTRVEAWLHNGWWPARINDVRNGSALLQGDVIPLGEGLKWISTFKYIREAPKNEDSGFGMIQPLNLKEEVCPKEMEAKLDVTVDKTSEGHLVLNFRRLKDAKRTR
eukprot:g6722.t1